MSGITSVSPRSHCCLYEAAKKVWNAICELVRRILEPLAGYFLKICVFRETALQGRFSKACMVPFARGVTNLWMKSQKIPNKLEPFNQVRFNKSVEFLAQFGKPKTLQTPDGTKIQWVLYTPETFNQWVVANGGIRDGEWIRPKTDADWEKLKKLEEFRWFEQEGKAFRAPAPVPNAGDKCVLRCQGFGRKIPMDKAFIGLHLAAGFNYAVFDWRDEISAKGYFEDAETVYQALLQEGFTPQRIKAMGSCRSTFVVSRLKELHHQDGLDVVMIHTQPSLRAAIEQQNSFARKIGLYGLPTIEKEGYDFDTLKRLRSLDPALSRICLVMSEGDKTVPPDTVQKLKQEAERIGPCELILEPKQEGAHDPHFDEPLRNPQVLTSYLAFLAQ